MPCSITNGALARPFGGLRVIITKELMVPFDAALTASKAANAPVGTMIRAPVSLARSSNSGRSSRRVTVTATSVLPASITGSARSKNSAGGKPSTMMSAMSTNSVSSTTGGAALKSFIRSTARALSLAEIATNSMPSTPASNHFATGRFTAPIPAIATFILPLDNDSLLSEFWKPD